MKTFDELYMEAFNLKLPKPEKKLLKRLKTAVDGGDKNTTILRDEFDAATNLASLSLITIKAGKLLEITPDGMKAAKFA